MAFSSPGVAGAQAGSLVTAFDWIQAVLLGPVGTALAVLAVAFVGFKMLSGDLSIRDGMRLVLGCFVLFGAPTMARQLMNLAGTEPQEYVISVPAPKEAPAATPARAPATANPFDPYTGAN